MGDEVDLEVSVDFDHGGNRYSVTRRSRTRKETSDQVASVASLVVRRTSLDGSSSGIPAGQTVLDSILPRQLSRFFFFNGERIESFIQKGSYAEVRQDIKTLLGLQQVERALVHLPKVERKLGTDVPQIRWRPSGQPAVANRRFYVSAKRRRARTSMFS